MLQYHLHITPFLTKPNHPGCIFLHPPTISHKMSIVTNTCKTHLIFQIFMWLGIYSITCPSELKSHLYEDQSCTYIGTKIRIVCVYTERTLTDVCDSTGFHINTQTPITILISSQSHTFAYITNVQHIRIRLSVCFSHLVAHNTGHL